MISALKFRKSGTDAKTKAYASGSDKEECRKFAKVFGEASGELTELYTEQIGQNYLREVENRARQIYDAFQARLIAADNQRVRYDSRSDSQRSAREPCASDNLYCNCQDSESRLADRQ